MAIASVGTLGTGASSTSGNSFTLATATNTLASGDFGILTVVTDNLSTVDGASSDHTSVSGGTGTWTKLGEYTNTVGGAAADGVATSVWLFEATGSVATGTTITMSLSGNATDKAASFWKFTKGSGLSILRSTTPSYNATDASNGFGSVSFSSLPSTSRLYFRGLGKEANSTTALTVSTNFTQITNARSRNNANAVGVWGEFRVNTSTGETSNPTLAVTGDTSGVFLALEETLPEYPSVGNSSLTGYAPVLALGLAVAAGSMAFTGYTPEASKSAGGGSGGLLMALNTLLAPSTNLSEQPSTGSIALTGGQPTVITGFTRQPSVGTLTIAGQQLQISFGSYPNTGTAQVTGAQPVVSRGYTPSVGSIALSGNTAAVGSAVLAQATSAALTGYTPVVGRGYTPSVGALTLTGYQPAPNLASIRTPFVGALSLTGYTPSIGGALATSPSTGALNSTGYQASTNQAVIETPTVGSLNATGYQITITQGIIRSPLVGAGALTSYQPSVVIPQNSSPSSGVLALTGFQPSISKAGAGGGGYGGLLLGLGLNFEPTSNPSPSRGNLALTGYAPSIGSTSGSSGSGLLAALHSLTQPSSVTRLTLVGYAPAVSQGISDVPWDEFVALSATLTGSGTKNAVYDPKRANPLVGALAFTGNAASVVRTFSAQPSSGSLALTGYQPLTASSFQVRPASGALSISGVYYLGYGSLLYGRGVYGTGRLATVILGGPPKTGLLSLIGNQPTVNRTFAAAPVTGALTLTGYTPNAKLTATPSVGSLSAVGYQPSAVTNNPSKFPQNGGITLSGNAPTLQRGQAISSVFVARRGFLELYADYSAYGNFQARRATLAVTIGNSAVTSVEFAALRATLQYRDWEIQPEPNDSWTAADSETDIWVEILNPTDKFNG